MVGSHNSICCGNSVEYIMNACKSVCITYGSIRDGSRTKRYTDGVVFCKHCDIFMSYVGKYCPCCSRLVRHKPRYMSSRQ